MNRINMNKFVAYGQRSVSYNVERGCTRTVLPVKVEFRVPAHETEPHVIEGRAKAALARRYKTAWFVSWGKPGDPPPRLHFLHENGYI